MSKAIPRKKKSWVVVYSPEGKHYFLDTVEQLDDLRAQIKFYNEEGWTFKDHKGRTGKFNLDNSISGETDLDEFYNPHDESLFYLVFDKDDNYVENTQQYYNNFA